jgi:nitrite reductase/ring-hydroxylating ferredoxin subunit
MLRSFGEGVRPVLHPVDDPERIPVIRYYDAAFYQAEVDHLWPHVWQMACRVEQLSEVGDWVEYENLGKSVLVVRTGGGIKAFHNACRHRGVPIAGGQGDAHGNCARSGFVCPFHGWRWDIEGRSTKVYGRHLFSERQLEGDDLDLVVCRSEVWGGCVWINHDDEAPSVRESLGPVADRLDAHNIDRLRAEWWYGTVLPANWKTAMEAFMEGLHVAATHPQLHHALDGLYHDMYAPQREEGGATAENMRKGALPGTTTRQAIDGQIAHLELLSEGMAGMVHAKEVEIARDLRDVDLPHNPNEAVPRWYGLLMAQITERLRAQGEPVPDLLDVARSAPVRAVEFLFPHYFLLPLFTSMSAYRIRPLGPESCYFELWSLTFFPEGEEPEPVLEPTMLPFDSPEFPPIPRQDYSNIPIQQKGLHSTGFEFMRLSRDVEGMISNYQRLIDGYLAGVPQEKLAAAQHWLGGNFDSQIHDIWA